MKSPNFWVILSQRFKNCQWMVLNRSCRAGRKNYFLQISKRAIQFKQKIQSLKVALFINSAFSFWASFRENRKTLKANTARRFWCQWKSQRGKICGKTLDFFLFSGGVLTGSWIVLTFLINEFITANFVTWNANTKIDEKSDRVILIVAATSRSRFDTISPAETCKISVRVPESFFSAIRFKISVPMYFLAKNLRNCSVSYGEKCHWQFVSRWTIFCL